MNNEQIIEACEQQLISKAQAYDNILPEYKQLVTENETLRNRVKYLESLIKEYTDKIISG